MPLKKSTAETTKRTAHTLRSHFNTFAPSRIPNGRRLKRAELSKQIKCLLMGMAVAVLCASEDNGKFGPNPSQKRFIAAVNRTMVPHLYQINVDSDTETILNVLLDISQEKGFKILVIQEHDNRFVVDVAIAEIINRPNQLQGKLIQPNPPPDPGRKNLRPLFLDQLLELLITHRVIKTGIVQDPAHFVSFNYGNETGKVVGVGMSQHQQLNLPVPRE